MLRTKQVRNDLLPARTYSSTEVAQLAQVTLRQLQWWDERNVVTPRHEGHKRLYELDRAIEITVIAELRRKGLPLQRIRHLLRLFRQEMSRRCEELLLPDSECYLLTDGKSIQLEDRHERMIDLLKSARKPMFLVSLSDQVRRLVGTPRRTPVGEASPGMRVRAAV
jgi:DNA-binding transcriptional MerR regulator